MKENLKPIQEEILRTLEAMDTSYAHPASSEELGKALNVTPSYIRKQIKTLVQAGIVTARRGIGGGYYLSRKKPCQNNPPLL